MKKEPVRFNDGENEKLNNPIKENYGAIQTIN